jgi:hypothetical protein
MKGSEDGKEWWLVCLKTGRVNQRRWPVSKSIYIEYKEAVYKEIVQMYEQRIAKMLGWTWTDYKGSQDCYAGRGHGQSHGLFI